MALYIQHGHGKSDKITAALHDQTIDGVIFGARNEKPVRLKSYLDELRAEYDHCKLLLDPQFYVSTLVPPRDRYLPEHYPYYEPGRTASDFTSLRRIRVYAERTLSFQVNLGLDGLVSPSVIFDSFADRWHQIALNLADASLECHAGLDNPPSLLLNFILSESALASRNEVDRFLDTVTQDDWEMDGFYLIVARNESSYCQRFDSERLAHLLYLVHVLSEVNQFRVICGYTDFVGIPLRAAGAAAFATGWHQSLRQFHKKHFMERRPGGQPPRERYSSRALVNSIMLGELQDIDEVNRLDAVLSGVPLDNVITGASSPTASDWNIALSERHHWQTLRSMDNALSGRVRSDVPNVVQQLQDADGLYRLLEAAGVTFERNTGKDHLVEWIRAIRSFQDMAGL